MAPPALPLLPLGLLTRRPRRVATEAAYRAMAAAVPLDGGVVLARTLGRHKLLVDAADYGHGPHLLLDGFWEWWTTVAVAGLLRPGETFVDAGAAYGYFTLLAAELVGPTGRVVAIEPHPRLAALLRRSLALNGMTARVTVHEAALLGPGAPAAVALRTAAHDLAGAHVPAAALDEDYDAQPGELDVPSMTVAALALRGPALVKLDIAGAEAVVWDGLAPLLGAGVRVLLAFDPGAGPAPAALLTRLAAAGPLRRVDPDGKPHATSAAELLAGGTAMLLLG